MPGILEYLMVENFKSYNGLQKIGPLKKFTAIIGPNGSGKSNFMDAISFVLGEKTANLRVKKLSELIHGASIGRPVSNNASVTLVYKDIDTGRITNFTRLVQGSSSEYRVDDNSVSKQDYAELLEKLGINIKARNFLVYQGAVESIAMKNPKEITSLFEEISRSNEYKDEYVNKKVMMDRSEEELHHMYMKKKGITAEKKEAQGEINEAKKYQNLKEELSRVQNELQLFKLYNIQQDIDQLNDEMERKRKEMEKYLKSKEKIDTDIREKRSNLAKITKDLQNIDKRIRDVELNLNKKRPTYIKAKENAAHIEKKLETAKKSRAAASKAHANHQNTIREFEEELAKIVEKQEEFEAKVEKEKEMFKVNVELEESQRKEYNRLKEEVTKLTAKYMKDLDSYEREQKADQDRYDSEMRKKNAIESRIQLLTVNYEENNKRIEKLKDNTESSEQQLQELIKKKAEIEEVVNAAKEQVEKITSRLEEINKELGDAKVDRHETERRNKKAEVVENLKKLYPGVYDRLLNLCKPIHKRYNIAVTKVMGKNMNAIVVDTEKTGRSCIQYLKEQMLEPETFLPLDYIEVKAVKERLRNIQYPKGVKLLYDVIKYDPPAIKKAVLYATNNALVCETAEDANLVAFDLGDGQRYDAVSLDGTFYQKCGFISGGSADLEKRARRWDEKELHALKYQKEKLSEELKEQMKRMRKESELMTLASQIKGLDTRIKYSRNDKITTEKNNEEITKEIQSNRDSLGSFEPILKEIQDRMTERDVLIKQLRQQMNTVEDKIFEDFCVTLGVENIRQYEERQNMAAQENERIRLQIENEKNSITSRLAYERSKDTHENVKRWERVVAEEENNLEMARETEKREMQAIEEEMKKVEQLKNDKISKKTECDSVEDEITEIKRGLSSVQRELSSSQKSLMTIECKLESRKSDRHSVLTHCKMECINLPLVSGTLHEMTVGSQRSNGVENGIGSQDMDDDDDDDGPSTQRNYENDANIKPDFSQLKNSLKNICEPDQIKKKEAELQQEINQKLDILQKIQAPNLRAIDRLEDVKDRLKETDNEVNNLRIASKKAKLAFEEVKRARLKDFTMCFESVAQRVDSIYKSLTNNASAQAFLVPENPEEPYLEGINYNCVAPGKRFQPMSNLSGGEKTVAALALLFAIHSYKPAPFFILDEVDAALDNTNISKVARFIREKTDSSFQCIVISLKEEFYGHASSLVGVASAPGDCTISQIYTIDLTQYHD
ncbi:structural maintenance of chromosomes 1 [Dermatophagoides farinae]|uniref:Structural maintenance of chromosomes protein n=1 Tax=Dermatophagoides farinae TaxID=6954 RepID=A0A922LAC4_DERFA|nr:structural maintenance of chromosomes protein 1A-like [Dermatophagoides farinae]KAH7636839.1 structural maintenance of chromosomes protein 1a-like protein 2 [Dermatophagoides farinae]KAH9528188.1 Structural maintenance of chromosomes protein 1B [Dermatophagoides farinae]